MHRSLEKRLHAARLVEQDIDERLRERDLVAVKVRIVFFSQQAQDFTNITNRRSGLFGLSFVGMAIYQKLRQNDHQLHEAVVQFLDEMITPITQCL